MSIHTASKWCVTHSTLKKLSEHSKSKHIFLAGGFNCPDIDLETLTVRPNVPHREIQQTLVDISIEHGLTHVHDQPTRQEKHIRPSFYG